MHLDLREHRVAMVPRALAEAHDRTSVGTRLTVRMPSSVDRIGTNDLIVGGGFALISSRGTHHTIERLHSLPDRVGPDLRVLLCGLNPSPYAADVGVGFARSGNRFWPAALASGLVSVDRDPQHALDEHRVGMTDLVKRATARANEIDRAEYTAGAERIAHLCALITPRVLCVVGVTGWRIAVDKKAQLGLQTIRLGDTLVYVMGNPSGLNAHVTVDDVAGEFSRVAALADGGST